ncbi:hypothetical protein TY50_23200 [Salmonella enterica]|nr:hypothetical protein [Salmonella enterica]MIO01448.1 hypothetical protein [Salmonella enterica]
MNPNEYDKHAKEVQQMADADRAREEAEQRKADERENRAGDAAYERMILNDQSNREAMAQQARQAREAMARQLAAKLKQQQANKQPPALDRRTPTHALDRGR